MEEIKVGGAGRELGARGGAWLFLLSLHHKGSNFCQTSLIHYPVQYIHGQHCTLPTSRGLAESERRGRLSAWFSFVLSVAVFFFLSQHLIQ